MGKVLIFESHPVQYRAPVYRRLQQLVPDAFEVVYGTDCSVRGHADVGFGRKIAWDEPLLEGYPCCVLDNLRGAGLSGRRSLGGKGVAELIATRKPAAVYLTGFAYDFDMAAYWAALRHKIPIWIRMETQDEAFARPRWKSLLRAAAYRAIYTPVSRVFAIGRLNREHYLRHGVPERKLRSAPYCTVDRFECMTSEQKLERRMRMRKSLGFSDECNVVAFFGKLIPKKDPALLAEALREIASPNSFGLLYVGSGECEPALRSACRDLSAHTVFAGFVNQTELPDYYLAADAVVLPSRRMGETWGLVVNEALQAGCAVVVTECVGSSREFGNWERVRVVPEHDAHALAGALHELARYERSFDWARDGLRNYSIEAAAEGIAAEIRSVY